MVARIRPDNRRWRPLAALLLAGALVMEANAQINPPADGPALHVPPLLPDRDDLADLRVDPAIRRLAERLDDPSFSAREEAMEALQDAEVDVAQLCALLAEETLSAEQRCRLLMILRRRLVYTPRGALGISMVARPGDPGGVEVLDLVAGMPAQRVLQIGDRITHIDGRRLHSGDELIIVVQARQPGEVTDLTVMREKRDDQGRVFRNDDGRTAWETLRIAVELGSSAALANPNPALPLRRGPVEVARAAEMEEALRRYAPQPKHVDLRQGQAADFIVPAQEPPPMRELADARRAMQNLQIQLILIAEGRLQRDATLRRTWNRQLAALRELAGRGDLPERDRQAVGALADRFAELIAD
jgi:hypothetical protein